MARPRADLPPPEAIRALADPAGRLAVRVTPGAREQGVIVVDGQVAVKVRAKPQDGAANLAVIALLAEALGCAPSKLSVLRGATSRDKLIYLG